MRIIAGSCKGRRLSSPHWPGLRPTSDKLRETLFNVVAREVPGARVLDVCAGTGAVGLEALSRGADSATFLEQDPRAVALISENAAACGFLDRCAIVSGPAERTLLHTLAAAPFQLVFVDPPYDLVSLPAVLSLAATQLAPDGLLVLEHATRRPAPGCPGLHARRMIRSGDSALTLFAATI